MSNVVVVASFKIREGKEDEALAALTSVIEQSHAEAGCLAYALHRDKNDPRTLVMVERWTSQVALDSHFQQPYVAQLVAAAGDIVSEPPTILFTEPVPVGDPMKGSL